MKFHASFAFWTAAVAVSSSALENNEQLRRRVSIRHRGIKVLAEDNNKSGKTKTNKSSKTDGSCKEGKGKGKSCAPSFMPSEEPSSSPSTCANQVDDINVEIMELMEQLNGLECAPSGAPSFTPSVAPSGVPSVAPSVAPSNEPSVGPSTVPSSVPSSVPSTIPSVFPSEQPSDVPSIAPSASPSSCMEDGDIFFVGDSNVFAATGTSVNGICLDPDASIITEDIANNNIALLNQIINQKPRCGRMDSIVFSTFMTVFPGDEFTYLGADTNGPTSGGIVSKLNPNLGMVTVAVDENFDILEAKTVVLVLPNIAYTDTMVTRFQTFLDDGGRLVLISDNNSVPSSGVFNTLVSQLTQTITTRFDEAAIPGNVDERIGTGTFLEEPNPTVQLFCHARGDSVSNTPNPLVRYTSNVPAPSPSTPANAQPLIGYEIIPAM